MRAKKPIPNTRFAVSVAIAGIVGILAHTFYSPSTALAENMESSSYLIQFGNFNISSGERTGASYNLTDTVGQTGAGPYGQYGSSGYFLGGGFQYIYQRQAFEFTLSKILIELGEIPAMQHSTDSHTIEITSGTPSGYVVYAFQERPLSLLNGLGSIDATTCDLGGCTITQAQVWSDLSVPGFGYNLQGNDIPNDFVNLTYYRPFADRSLSQPMQVVMSANSPSFNRLATVTYKAGVIGTEMTGEYETSVVFVAVPGY